MKSTNHKIFRLGDSQRLTMKLTIEVFQEPETPNQWTARCEELDVISAHTSPEVAIEAVAEAVRMTLVYEMKRENGKDT